MSECKIISGGIAGDDRGFVRFVNDFDPMTAGIRRFYQVENHRAGFIRAWHGHVKEGKYVYVPRGAALIGAIKMNLEGMGLGECCPRAEYVLCEEIQKFVLTGSIPKVLYIPPGYANGFKTLTDDAILMFFSTSTLEESKGDDIRFPYRLDNFWTEDYR